MLSTIIENASILDGTGMPAYTTDVGLAGDRIALVGNLADRDAAARVDATGKTLAPGFIDVHAHSDELWLALPRCDGKVAQGVTTEIGGNCGTSPFPSAAWSTLDEFFAAVERNGIALNVATLVGLGTTRRAIAGESERRLETAELASQAALVRAACEQGALGASSGLIYVPGRYADMAELIELAAAARDGGAPRYVSHVRSESDDLIDAIDEALTIGERARVGVQCSHHKAQYPRNWGKVHATMAAIDRARERGIAAYADVYPYVASWTELATILPAHARLGGNDAAVARLRDPQYAATLALELELARGDQWHDMLITEVGSERNERVAGMRVDELARAWNLSPARAAIRLLAEESLEVGSMFFSMNEDDVAAVLSAGFTCIGSDASIRALDGPTARGLPHPRTFGTFPRVFGRFVRQRGALTMPDAVRRMTSLPATIFGLRDRGEIAPGKFADLVVFDAATVCDVATYERPYAFPLGIDSVYVNGQAVYDRGAFTNARPGRALRGGA
ncbi:MAG TPA: amidohydrolase family protein [Verrucomicrobiae bacterium]|nr:amidohydrolase family protein [Verrucomicrobiae bacterium]